jgi:hypothetical protein
MDDLAVKVGEMDREVDAVFNEYLESINGQLEKNGLETISITSREEFDAEK